MLRLPVHLKQDNTTELPTDTTYYLVGKNGTFLHKNTGLIEALVKVESVPVLHNVTSYAKMNIPKLPVGLMAQIVLFFREVYKLHKSEAIVLIYYSQEKKEFMIDSVPQEVSSAGVRYKFESKLGAGYQLVGSIHSHADFSAFHSGVDVHDEQDFDGLHITIGHNNHENFSLSSTIAVNNNRFVVESETVVEGVRKVQAKRKSNIKRFRPVNEYKLGGEIVQEERSFWDKILYGDWDSKKLKNWVPPPQCPYAHTTIEPVYDYSLWQDRSVFYELVFPENKGYEDYPFPPAWLDEVRGQSLFGMKKYMGDFREKHNIHEKNKEDRIELPNNSDNKTGLTVEIKTSANEIKNEQNIPKEENLPEIVKDVDLKESVKEIEKNEEPVKEATV